MIVKKFLILAALSILSTASFSQKKVWSLKECVDYAMENNVDVKNNTLNLELAEISENQAKFDYIPTLSANAGYSMNAGRALDPTTYEFTENSLVNNINAGLGLNAPLFAGFQKYYNLKRSQKERLIAIEDIEYFKNTMSLNIAMYYLEIIYNKELIVSLEKQLEISKINIDKMNKLLAVGKATRGSVMELEAQMANEEYMLADGENRLQTSILNICQLLEIKDYSNFDVLIPRIGDLENILPQQNVQEIYESALNLPQIKADNFRIETSQLNLKIARSRYYPSLSFNAGYSSGYSDTRTKPELVNGNVVYEKYLFKDQFKDNASSSLSIGMSIPIFNGFNVRNSVKQAKVQVKRAEFTAQLSLSKLYKEVQKAYVDARGAMIKYGAALKKIVANERSLADIENKFNEGAATIVEYNVAKNNLVIAQTQLLQAKYDFMFKVQVINFYLGTPIGEGAYLSFR